MAVMWGGHRFFETTCTKVKEQTCRPDVERPGIKPGGVFHDLWYLERCARLSARRANGSGPPGDQKFYAWPGVVVGTSFAKKDELPIFAQTIERKPRTSSNVHHARSVVVGFAH
jgi:hypothetical protein